MLTELEIQLFEDNKYTVCFYIFVNPKWRYIKYDIYTFAST